MRDKSAGSTSIWMVTGPSPLVLPPPTSDLRVDVCVIGAGLAGMTIAYLLARAGKRVAVVDDGPVGGGETQRTTAHLSNAIDAGCAAIERLHGLEGARVAAECHTAAIDRIELIAREEGIEWDEMP